MQRLDETLRQSDVRKPPQINELVGPPLGDGHGRYFVTHVIKDDEGGRLLRVIDRTSTEPTHAPLRAYVFDVEESATRNLEKSLALASKARDESLVPIIDWCIADARVTVILEGDKAIPLFDWIEDKGELTEMRAVEFAIGLCNAAHRLHMQGVSGIRLAPGAVFMRPDGSGPLAKAYAPYLTSVDQRPASEDVEEIAQTLTHLLGCTTADQVRDRTLRQVVLRAAGLHRQQYLSADAFAADLRRYLGQYPIDWTSLSGARDLALWARRKPLAATLIAATLLMCIVSTGVGSFAITQSQTRTLLQAAYEQERALNDDGNEAIMEMFSAMRPTTPESTQRAAVWDFTAHALKTGEFQMDPREWLGEDGADVDFLVRLTMAMTVLSRDKPSVYGPEARAAMQEEIRQALDNGALDELESRLRATLQTVDASDDGLDVATD